ncbi:VWA domain-containing protein [Cellulomonas soli]|uniref:VWA domain-containing protein n=1 Tax=Cellulomonas soli TaxID=931535 RepID=A0A512PB94_9CELL|nr:VWA domain-containing protein [Cellulomonas soli]NYI61104.1 hypothetical protein [Cellulomonas soli]GEP68479.1 hypothetical protein CSO01_11940 [Cellulomonas soli]
MSAVDPALVGRWEQAWPQALGAWGRTSRMHAPVLHADADLDGSAPSFAWYDTATVEVHIDLAQVARLGLGDHAVAILAHEVGHHLLAPADRRSAVRIAARVRAGLVDLDDQVSGVANLWTDLLINDRLQRRAGVDLAAVWRTLGPPHDPVMALVLRACEILWGLRRGALAGPAPVGEDHANLLAKLVRAYGRDPVAGAGGFASLVRNAFPVEALTSGRPRTAFLCADACTGTDVPYGLASDDSLAAPVVHPALDPAVVGAALPDAPQPPADDAADAGVSGTAPDTAASPSAGSRGNTLLPAELHAVLAALGSRSTLEDVAVAWYREHAAPHLVRFPERVSHRSPEPLLGGLEDWSVGEDLGDIDWVATVAASPVVLPGRTTRRRELLEDDAAEPERRPLDLDLYLDSSGSMPDPKRHRSAVALGGAVLALSALRAGAWVQATTWSGPQQIAGTDGFTRDATVVLRAIVAHFGGGTSFPLGLLARTHLGGDGRRPTRRGPTHLAVVSDDGVSTMFTAWDPAEKQVVDLPLAARALEAAEGGGTLLLDVPRASVAGFEQMAPGFDVHDVRTEDDLVAFARAFARRTWGSRTSAGGAR